MTILKKILLIVVLFFFGNCQDTDRLLRRRSVRDSQGNYSNIRTTESQFRYGEYIASDYSGPTCEDEDEDDDNRDRYTNRNDKDCYEQCEDIYDNESDLCEELPVELISNLYNLYIQLEHFRARDGELDRRIDDNLFGIMIDIHESAAINLIREWSPREIGEFLKWVARSYSVATGLLNHDTDHTILNFAFRRLDSNERDFPLLIGVDLEGLFETFLSLAENRTQNQKNLSAFVIFHEMLNNECTDRNCKMRAYCLREEYETSREMENACSYKSEIFSSSSRHCYIYGADIWAYWNQLNYGEEFEDEDFDRDFEFSEDECDDFCDNKGIDCQRNHI